MVRIKKKQAQEYQDDAPQPKVKSEKRKKTEDENSEKSPKILKKERSQPDETKKSKFIKSSKKGDPTNPKGAKPKTFKGKNNIKIEHTEKIEDWTKFKKEKKELRIKRIKARTKDNFDRIQEAKKMGEKVRLKTLKEDERNKVINQLHGLLKENYDKFVLAHDTARIVQWLLKYSSKIVVHQISKVSFMHFMGT